MQTERTEAREQTTEDAKAMACLVGLAPGGTFSVQEVEEVAHSGDTCVIVTLHAAVCGQCGNRTYDVVNVRKMEEVVRRLERGDVADWRPVGTVYRA